MLGKPKVTEIQLTNNETIKVHDQQIRSHLKVYFFLIIIIITTLLRKNRNPIQVLDQTWAERGPEDASSSRTRSPVAT